LTASPQLSGPDPLLPAQWHLPLVRAQEAWQASPARGAGVRVAVVDDAVELVHDDLRPNVVEGASHSYRQGNRGSPWPLPCQTDDDHGTAVAGLVLARDGNAIGGAGVAPRASLVAFDALSTSFESDIADALRRGSDLNAIYQNSWGAPDTGALNSSGRVFEAAIAGGIASGRGGLGSIYVFPAGNGGEGDNANYDGYVNKLGVITVCAIDQNRRAPFYAEPGANIMVCAPGSRSFSRPGDDIQVTTTAVENGYRSDFAGTSASTPIVSGVVALMLADNPALSWRDVRLILASTAVPNDLTDRGWEPALGRAQGFNHKYGFGIVDAKAAVDAARNWSSVGGSAAMRTCGPYTRAPARPLPDPLPGTNALQPQSDSVGVTAADCAITQVEFVELAFSATHPDSGDLRIRLRSPAETTSQLADARTCANGPASCGDYAGWVFGSNRHMGEPAVGTWTLTVTDMTRGNTGTLDSWSLRIHGR
jgi:proprotein convertase subtilisin/kexin type 2